MFRWLFLNESVLSSAEHTLWKISTLRIILLSALVLEAVIAVHSSLDALAVGAYHIIGIVVFFYALLTVALFYSARHPGRSAAILIGAVYAAGTTIVLFVDIDDIAKLGVILVYITPIIGRLFFGKRVALALMVFNFLPFFYLLRNEPFFHFPQYSTTLAAGHSYIQSLLFVFFNVCTPLAVFRVLHALDASARRDRANHAALTSSHAQYQEFFENAGGAILLCQGDGTILQANRLANELIGGDSARPGRSMFDDLTPVSEAKAVDTLDGARGRKFRTPDGRLLFLEYVTRTSDDHYIVTARDAATQSTIEQALERSQESVSFLSTHDALTRLPNRKSLRSHLGRALPELDGGTVMAMVSIRLNSIRLVNEKLGALVGDAYIEQFSEALRRTLPADAFCARLRSIVFSIVLPPARSTHDVVGQVDRLRRQLPQEITLDGHRLLVQFSTGIALARPGDAAPEELMRRSEVALDSARRSAPDTVALFDEADAAQISRRIEIELGIVGALKQGEFRLVYQPKVDGNGRIAGLEALIRWHSPVLGDVSPAEFIPIAENSGLIHGVTRFVIEDCCAFIRDTLDRGYRCPPIALNLSAIDVIRTDLLDLIDAARTLHATPAGLLEFEITETGLIGNEALAIRHLQALKTRGLRIAIDDFGTGYSSFSKLCDFPVSSIKIDQSFVTRIGQSAKSESIIKAIVSLARILSCTSVAEGVESEEQLNFLKAIGCDQFQGYYFFRPLEVAQLRALDVFAPLPASDTARSAPLGLAFSLGD